MAMEIRAARADEFDEFGLIGAYVFAGAFGDGPDNAVARGNRPEWTTCAFVDGRMAATYSAIPFTMRANGSAVPMAGVSAVGTLPEYRRRGLLRAMTTHSFAQMRERGQGIAALWASQSAIYQRYGYALSNLQTSYRIDTVDIAFFDGNGGSADVARVAAEEAYDIVKPLYAAFVAPRMGYLHRAKALWQNNALSATAATGPAHGAVARDGGGAAVGYVIYHLRGGSGDHPTRNQEITIKDLVWLTVDAYRSLWSWLARHDLVGRIVWTRAPSDDPAAELLVEPRLLHAQVRDGAWLRLVDARIALAGRGYDVNGRITFELAPDSLAPWNEGRFALECATQGARVVDVSDECDLRMTVKALASLYCGMRTPRQLAAWGLLTGNDAALERATAIFATRYAPHHPDSF